MKKNKLHKHLQFESSNKNLKNISISSSQKRIKPKNVNSMSQSIKENNELLLSFNSNSNNRHTGKTEYLNSGNYPNMSIISNIPNLNNTKLNKSLKNTMVIQEYITKVRYKYNKNRK